MHRINRIVSSLVLAAFLLNTVVADYVFAQMIGFKDSNNNLATMSTFDDLNGIEAKDIGDIEKWAAAAFNYVNSKGFDVTSITLNKFAQLPEENIGSTIFKMPGTKFFVKECKTLPDGTLKMKATRKDSRGARIYFVEYNPANRELSVYPEGKSKRRTPEDRTAIDKYKKNNEEIISAYIRDRIKNPNNFVEIEGRAAGIGWDKNFPNRIRPNRYLPAQFMDFLRRNFNDAMNAYGVDFDKVFAGKNFVFIRMEQGSNYPEIFENDQPVKVVSRSSNNAVYFFIENREYEKLVNCPAESLEGIDDGSLIRNTIHEGGVVCGLPYTVVDRVTINDFDGAAGLSTNCVVRPAGVKMTPELARELSGRFPHLRNLKPVDLDVLRGVNSAGEQYERDYAMGEGNSRTKAGNSDPLKGWSDTYKIIALSNLWKKDVFTPVDVVEAIGKAKERYPEFVCEKLGLLDVVIQLAPLAKSGIITVSLKESQYKCRVNDVVRQRVVVWHLMNWMERTLKAYEKDKRYYDVNLSKERAAAIKDLIEGISDSAMLAETVTAFRRKAAADSRFGALEAVRDSMVGILDEAAVALRKKRESADSTDTYGLPEKRTPGVNPHGIEDGGRSKFLPPTTSNVVPAQSRRKAGRPKISDSKQKTFRSDYVTVKFSSEDQKISDDSVATVFKVTVSFNEPRPNRLFKGFTITATGIDTFANKLSNKMQVYDITLKKTGTRFEFSYDFGYPNFYQKYTQGNTEYPLGFVNAVGKILSVASESARDRKLTAEKSESQAAVSGVNSGARVNLGQSAGLPEKRLPGANPRGIKDVRSEFLLPIVTDANKAAAAGENPVAGTGQSVPLNQLLHHPMLNALINMALDDKSIKQTIIYPDKGLFKKIYYMGNETDASFLDIFNALVQNYAIKKKTEDGRVVSLVEAEMDIFKVMMSRAGISIASENLASGLEMMRKELARQVEHFGVDNTENVYVLRRYRPYQSTIIGHAQTEKHIHNMAIDKFFEDALDAGLTPRSRTEKYRAWRADPDGMRLAVNIGGKGWDILPITGELTYNEFVQAAHNRAEAKYPITSIAGVPVVLNVMPEIILSHGEAPTAGVKPVDRTEEELGIKRAGIILDAVLLRLGEKWPRVASTLENIYPMALPYLLKARKGNPVHHSLKVVEFISEIAIGEGSSEAEVLDCVLAALLHDTGAEGKIRKADIDKEKDPVKHEELRQEAIKLRLAHMSAGAEVAEKVIAQFNAGKPMLAIQPTDVEIIKDIIRIHDNPSIAEYENKNDGTWLFSENNDPLKDKLVKFHREADRLWMLSEEGLEVDLQRDEKKGKRDPADRVKGNIKRHQEEYALYSEAFGDGAIKYGFRENTLYRTETGFKIFKQLIRRLASKYSISNLPFADTAYTSVIDGNEVKLELKRVVEPTAPPVGKIPSVAQTGFDAIPEVPVAVVSTQTTLAIAEGYHAPTVELAAALGGVAAALNIGDITGGVDNVVALGRQIAVEPDGKSQLLLPMEFFAGQLKKHQGEFGERFDLSGVSGLTDSPKAYIDNLLSKVKPGEESRAIALVPEGLPKAQVDLIKQRTGIRVIPINMDVIRTIGSLSGMDKRMFQVNTYAMMYDLRHLKETDNPASLIYRISRDYYAVNHIDLKGVALQTYLVEGIMKGNIDIMMAVCLRPTRPADAKKEHDELSFPMIFA